MRRIIFCVLIGFTTIFSVHNAKGQIIDLGLSFDEVLQGGSDDMSTYMEFYTKPFFDGFGTGINNGWYNTAAPHNTLGFDLTVYTSLVSVPEEELFFTFLDSDYNNLALSGGGSADLPTLLGGTTSEELVSTYSQGPLTVSSAPFPAPEGFGEDLPTNKVFVPMAQLAIGLPKGFELIGRYAPAVSTETLDLSFFGIGLKHDIKQWIPGIRLVPIDLSVLIGYTSLDMEVFMDNSTIQGPGERSAIFDVTAITFQALVSKKVSILTAYGGLGFNSVKSDFSMTGEYELVPGISLTDPVSLSFSLNGMRATAGVRI